MVLELEPLSPISLHLGAQPGSELLMLLHSGGMRVVCVWRTIACARSSPLDAGYHEVQLGSGDDGHGCVDRGFQQGWSAKEVVLPRR